MVPDGANSETGVGHTLVRPTERLISRVTCLLFWHKVYNKKNGSRYKFPNSTGYNTESSF
jgi:hypothetical protein